MKSSVFALLSTLVVLAWPHALPAHPGSGIAIDGRGHVFFCDTGAGLWEIRPEGSPQLIHESAVHWLTAVPNNKIPNPPASFGRWIETVAAPDSETTLVLCSDYPCVSDAEGRIVLGAGRPPQRLLRRHPDGRETPLATEPLAAAHLLNSGLITGLAIAADGTIVVMALGDQPTEHALLTISPEGKARTLAQNFIPLPGSDPSAFRGSLCRGIACDAHGGVYVTATGIRRVIHVDTSGKSRVVLASAEPWSPTGVAVSGEDLYVLEYTDTPRGADPNDRELWAPRVRKISRDGTVSLVAEVKRTRGPSRAINR